MDFLFVIYLNVIGELLIEIGFSDYIVVIFEVNLKFIRLVKFFYRVYFYNKVNFFGLRKFMWELLFVFFVFKLEERLVDVNWNMFKILLLIGMF